MPDAGRLAFDAGCRWDLYTKTDTGAIGARCSPYSGALGWSFGGDGGLDVIHVIDVTFG
uniref:hypothetical protein n=1 Tax=Streptomyces sp. TG1A-60 TaxID=3129111 RepID=UPI00403FDA0A